MYCVAQKKEIIIDVLKVESTNFISNGQGKGV